MKLKSLLLILSLIPLFSYADECAVCNKKLRNKFIRTKEADYCSKKCYHSTLPKCGTCARTCLQGSVSMMGKNFCSKSCMRKFFKCAVCGTGLERVITLVNSFGQKLYCCQNCTKKPSCYYCSFPSGTSPLADGRTICRLCRSTVVGSSVKVREIFQDLRDDLAKYYNFNKTHRIELIIVDRKRLLQESKDIYQAENGRNMALMRYQKKTVTKRLPGGRSKSVITDEKCRIYVLHSVPKDLLIDALVHELAHDHIRHNVGEVMDLASEEGFCELVASLYNERRGKKYLNAAKESNKDPIYGGGFRKMQKIYRQKRSLKKTLEYVR